MFKTLFITLVFSGLVSNKLKAQFNFQVGYDYTWSSLSKLNNIIDYYNSSHPEFSKSMKELHALHGIEIGIRYQFTHIALTSSWSNQLNKNYAITTNPSGAETKQELFYKNQVYTLGLESVAGVFSIGTSIDFRNFGIKGRTVSTDNKYEILNLSSFGSSFYTQLDFPVSQRMALLLRLHYSFPWKNIDLNELNKSINPVSSATYPKEKFQQLGISLIFSNGFQSRY